MKLCKVGDSSYGLSLQQTHATYSLFPQRERFLIDEFEEIKLVDEHTKCDAFWIDNPIHFSYHLSKLSKPVVFDAIDWYEEMLVKEGKVHLLAKLYRGIERLKRSRKLILVAQSPLILNFMLKIERMMPINSVIVPNGYDEGLHKYARPKANNKIALVYAGKMGRWYSNLAYFIKFAYGNKDANLTLYGDGELRTYFEKVANKSQNILFRGFVDRKVLPEAFNEADIGVFPVDDCSPIVVSEYMACGRPVINLGKRLNWLVRNGVEGYCLRSSEEIEPAIEKTMQSLQKLGSNARSRIEPYSWRRGALLFEEAVRTGLNEIGAY